MTYTLDWKKYEEKALEAIAEGSVLLKNNGALPLAKDSTVSVFGRIQSNYYKSGTGSGGKVNVTKVYNIIEGLEQSGHVKLNKNLLNTYAEWEKENPFDEGLGWGKEKWCQEEMPVSKELAQKAASESDCAVVIIGRTAGEDKDNTFQEGSYLLTKTEMEMLHNVRSAFKSMTVLLNVGNIVDMSFVEEVNPDAVMYVWQGGMLGGLGTGLVLTQVPPTGHLTDTIAKDIKDYPSTANFGNPEGNIYAEDIYVGYRYFETFAKDKVLYPFGFGLTYTTFSHSVVAADVDSAAQTVRVKVKVTNTGNTASKDVSQIYVSAPNGKLGKPSAVLVDFAKTSFLEPGCSEEIDFTVPFSTFASYDDSGATGEQTKNAFVLEEGTYRVFEGTDVRQATSSSPIASFQIETLTVIKKCEEALAPVKAFERFARGDGNTVVMEATPTRTADQAQRRKERLPQELQGLSPLSSSPVSSQTDTSFKLQDVVQKKCTMEQFVSQFTDDDLSCIIRGEGMSSSLVTAGTASAYGGVSPRLRETFGIPACCCDDGPSGMRLDCGIKAFALPNGTMLASSFNRQMVKELYTFTGYEMMSNHVDNLLGPGMNIHRNPLNGRNFEYFSEDPFLTGHIGSAMVQGLQAAGVTGTIKHFCGNNQEANRYAHDSVISQRALREIYLKGFQIAVENGADSVMTTYGLVNGAYTASSYDLNTTILRKDWGFKGIVMTDWWANIGDGTEEPDPNNFAAMVRAQNDLYMVCPNGAENATGDNTLSSLGTEKLSRGELQLCAMNICRQVAGSYAMKRLMETATVVEIVGRPKDENDISLEDVEFIQLGKELTIDLTYQESKANTNYILAFEILNPGTYDLTLTASSELGQLAQLPCTIFYQGIPCHSFTFHGTEGKEDSITKTMVYPRRFSVCRLSCGANGLKLKELKIKFVSDNIELPW